MPEKYLCPSPEAKMVIYGSYFDEQFSYVKLSVAACDQASLPEGLHCSSVSNFAQRLYLPLYRVNYEESESEHAVEADIESF